MPKRPDAARKPRTHQPIGATMTLISQRLTGNFWMFGSGRESSVLIREFAKNDWRFLGQKATPDEFLIELYGLKNVHQVTLPFKDGHKELFWIGKATIPAGRKEILRLQSEKLPPIDARRESLDERFVKAHVAGGRNALIQSSRPLSYEEEKMAVKAFFATGKPVIIE